MSRAHVIEDEAGGNAFVLTFEHFIVNTMLVAANDGLSPSDLYAPMPLPLAEHAPRRP